MKISINTIEKAKKFVSICSKYHDGDILVKQNKYAIDGKSILGIFSLNLIFLPHLYDYLPSVFLLPDPESPQQSCSYLKLL